MWRSDEATHVNILFDLFEYKPSRPCATVTFSSGNTKSGSNAEAAPAACMRSESILYGIVGEFVCYVCFFGAYSFHRQNMKNSMRKFI